MNISKKIFFIVFYFYYLVFSNCSHSQEHTKTYWDKIDKFYFDKHDLTVEKYGRVWEDTDNKIKFSISWDKENLYFYADVIDNEIYTDIDEEMYLNDCIAIYIYSEKQNAEGLKWFFSPAIKNKESVQGNAPLKEGLMKIEPDKIKVESTINKNGYTMYITIPVGELQISEPEVGKTIRFTILNTDADKDDKWGQVMWIGMGDDWNDYSFLEFMEDGNVSFLTPDKKRIKMGGE